MSTELFDAIDQQDVERVVALLAQGVDPNTLLAEPPYQASSPSVGRMF